MLGIYPLLFSFQGSVQYLDGEAKEGLFMTQADVTRITRRPLLPSHQDRPGHRMCMLIITHACNLNCSYCYEKHKDDKKMSFDLAKRLIEHEMEVVANSSQFDFLEIHFMGGEPFTNFPLIQQVVEWLESIERPVQMETTCSTNGTLLDEERKQWLRKHRDFFWPTLSYDGTEAMQTENRGSARGAIDLPFFIENWPRYTCHMTISKETLPDLANGILSLQRAGGWLDIGLAQGVDWTKEDAAVYAEQLRLLADFYLSHDDFKPVNLLSDALYGIGETQTQQKYCGTGTNMVTYDVDGTAYPCHMFSPVVCGKRALRLENSGIRPNCLIEDPECSDCNLQRWCPTCYGFNYNFRQDIAKRDHRFCPMILEQAKAAARFQTLFYEAHRAAITDVDIPQLKAALNAYTIFFGTTEKERR